METLIPICGAIWNQHFQFAAPSLRPLDGAEDYPEASLELLYGGQDRLLIDSILCRPVEEFLKELRPDHELVRD